MYGHYMLTHNVNPESGSNLPQYQQVYENALKYGLRKNDGMRVPEMPRKSTAVKGSQLSEPTLRSGAEAAVEIERNPIMPHDGPRTVAQKLGKSKA